MVRLEHPIAFMSKSLTKTERNWTTIEKECNAIVHTLCKYEYLLHDVKFKNELREFAICEYTAFK